MINNNNNPDNIRFKNCPVVEDESDNALFTSTIQNMHKLFHGKLLSIAPKQRPYEWTLIEMRTLLDDICTSWNDNEKAYFLGSILLKKENTKIKSRNSIVDGQQRLTSICILLAAIRRLVSVNVNNTNNNTQSSILGKKEDINAFMRGKLLETKPDAFIKLENDEGNQIFEKYIINEPNFNFPKKEDAKTEIEYIYPTIKEEDFDSKIEELKQIGLVTSISSENMARNYMLCLNYLLKHIQNPQSIYNLYSFIRLGCTFIVTTIEEPVINEWLIFNTINNRGRELSYMDSVKGQFVDSYRGTEKEKSLLAWNRIYQELGEDDFSLLLESINIHYKNTINTSNESSSKESSNITKEMPFKEMISKWANDEFIVKYLIPIYEAIKIVKYFDMKQSKYDKSINMELEKFNFIHNSFLQNLKKISINSRVIVILLIAILNSIVNKINLFDCKELTNIEESIIYNLLYKWNIHLLNVSISESEYTFVEMFNMIKRILRNENISIPSKFREFKTKSVIESKLKRQDVDKLKNTFETVLKLIKFEEEKTPFSDMKDLKAEQVFHDYIKKPRTSTSSSASSSTSPSSLFPTKTSTLDSQNNSNSNATILNRLKQIGNFALIPSKYVGKELNKSILKKMKEFNKKTLEILDDDIKADENADHVWSRTVKIVDSIREIVCKCDAPLLSSASSSLSSLSSIAAHELDEANNSNGSSSSNITIISNEMHVDVDETNSVTHPIIIEINNTSEVPQAGTSSSTAVASSSKSATVATPPKRKVIRKKKEEVKKSNEKNKKQESKKEETEKKRKRNDKTTPSKKKK